MHDQPDVLRDLFARIDAHAPMAGDETVLGGGGAHGGGGGGSGDTLSAADDP